MKAKIENMQGKHVLLLQGPMGFFFKKLDRFLRKNGGVTFRIGLNMGDRLFSYADNYMPYRGTLSAWEKFLEQFLKNRKIEKIFLFGDCRPYQKIAKKVAYRMKIEVYVFEEGYVRPHYITLERFGVNGFSQMPRKASFYHALPNVEIESPKHARHSKLKMILSATLYYAAANIFFFRYPFYEHHRDFSAIKEAFYGIRSFLRKGLYMLTERRYDSLIRGGLSGYYYFVPLQTYNDFQILQHSNYRSIEKFIIEVLESFARHAPVGRYLLFKHHPVDRGRRDYTVFIRQQAQLLDIEKRIIILHDVHLPTCLKHAIGTITINSTVGFSSIGHNTPTITLGNAIYDIEGLTSKGMSLKKFWHQCKKPDKLLYLKFKRYLIETTQLNGSFYGLFPVEFR
ncbi:capsule polysaccharide export protein [Sulfurovum sp. NBC37-1]|nr:capsule polysaccharide export protein [Sulfurovum sp. NBC37-1]